MNPSASPAWPRSERELQEEQRRLAELRPEPWVPGQSDRIGATFVTFSTPRDPGPGERSWAAAVVVGPDAPSATADRAVVSSGVTHPYRPGLLALREGPLLERAVRALLHGPDVLLVNATGRDHPRGAGLALHLGAILGIPTVGITDRPLVATGPEPAAAEGSSAPLLLAGESVGFRVRTRAGTRSVCAHAGWRTDPETAAVLLLAAVDGARTPHALRLARLLARSARAREEGRTPPGWSQDRSPTIGIRGGRPGRLGASRGPRGVGGTGGRIR